METLLLLKNKKARSGMRYEPTFDCPLRGGISGSCPYCLGEISQVAYV
jgi:hypothetical protein